MSFAQDALDAGMTSILASNGEALTFRGVALTGLVTRDQSWRFNHTPGVPGANESVIELLVSAVPTPPRKGEHFTDQFGSLHRIARVKRVTSWWRLECVASPDPGQESEGGLLTGAGLGLLTGAGAQLKTGSQ